MRALIPLVLLSGCYPLIPGSWDDYDGVDSDVDTDVDTNGDTDTDTDPDTTPGTCSADAFEPNESRSAARAVSLPFARQLTACEGDNDWFSFPVNAGCTVSASLDFRQSDANLDLFLYSGGTVVSSATSFSDDEQLTYTFPTDANAYLLVGNDDGEASYGLSVTMSCAPVGCDAGEGTSMPTNGTGSGSLCDGDEDVYALSPEPAPGCLVESDLSTSSGEAILFFEDDGLVVGTGIGGSDGYVRTIAGEGDPAMRLTRLSGADVDYSVTTTATCPSAVSCPSDDIYEPNTQSEPVGLPWNTTIEAAVCGTEDWFVLSGQPGCTGTVEVRFTHALGDVDAYIRDFAGTSLASGTSTSNLETLTYDAAEPVLLRVIGYNGAQNTYEVMTTLSCN